MVELIAGVVMVGLGLPGARVEAVGLKPANWRTLDAHRKNSGFTLLELLVVMVIIGLLVGYVGPRYFNQIGKSEISAARTQIDGLEKAVEQDALDVRKFPSDEQGLNALVERPAAEPRWQGPYLKKAVPLDPWGRPYVYRTLGPAGDFEILSYGKDGVPGGDGESADISNK